MMILTKAMMTISYQELEEFSQHLFAVGEGGVQERVPGPLLLQLNHQLRHRGVSVTRGERL